MFKQLSPRRRARFGRRIGPPPPGRADHREYTAPPAVLERQTRTCPLGPSLAQVLPFRHAPVDGPTLESPRSMTAKADRSGTVTGPPPGACRGAEPAEGDAAPCSTAAGPEGRRPGGLPCLSGLSRAQTKAAYGRTTRRLPTPTCPTVQPLRRSQPARAAGALHPGGPLYYERRPAAGRKSEYGNAAGSPREFSPRRTAACTACARKASFVDWRP